MKFLTCLILSVFTTVADHTFRTQCSVKVNAPADAADEVIDQLIYDFQYDFEHLFDWAFLKLGQQNNEDRDALLLQSKMIIYEPENNYGSITVDVVVPGFLTIPNITAEGVIIDEYGTGAYDFRPPGSLAYIDSIRVFSRHIFISADKTGKIFDKAYGNLYVVPLDSTHCVYTMDINMRFEWFLRMFITKRVWRNTLQWRAVRYLNHLKRAAEDPSFMKSQQSDN